MCLRMGCGALSVCMASLRAPAELAAAVPVPHQSFVPLQPPTDCTMTCLPLPMLAEPPFPLPMPSCVACVLWHVGAPLWQFLAIMLAGALPRHMSTPWHAFLVLIALPQATAITSDPAVKVLLLNAQQPVE